MVWQPTGIMGGLGFQGKGGRGQDLYGPQDVGIDISQRQQGMAEEQWDWQKRIYEQRLEAAKGGASGLESLVNQYNTAYGAARTANEERYQQMLGIADQTTNQRQVDIRSDYMGQQSDMMQQLSRLGMGNTTIGANLGTGVQREMQGSLNRSADALQGTKLGIMERRTDEYPQNNMILALAQQLGQAGMGMEGGIFSALSQMTPGGPAPRPQPVGPGGPQLQPVGPRPPG